MAKQQVSNTLKKLARSLFEQEAEQAALIDALVNPVDRPTAVLWPHGRPADSPFDVQPRQAWQPPAVDLMSIDQRPGRHLLHDQGELYCLDPSSVFAAQVLTSVPAADSIVDVCASPGGKAILSWQQLRPQKLLCNEVIGKRTGALISNLKRCRIHPAQVCSIDSSDLAETMGACAEVVLVDAPCSGQSLLARGKKSPGCFHPATINMNANRQRRILSNAVRLVAPGGWLAYMSCTYSLKENERNLDWLLKKNPQLEAVEVPLLADYRSPYTDTACYRLWPYNSVGAGSFTALLRSHDDTQLSRHWTVPHTVWSSVGSI